MSLQSSAQRAWSLLRQKAHGQRQATHSTSKPTNRNSTVVSFVQRFHSHKAAQRLLTTRSAHKNFVARTYTTESSDSESNKSGNDKKVIKLTSGPNGGQREPTSEELKEMLRESERRKGLILNMAIAAFIAADMALLGFWYFSSEEDPNSPSYVPSDWKHLVLANLGVSSPQLVPPQYVGTWESVTGDNVSFSPRGQFTQSQQFNGTSEVKVKSTGSVFSADEGYITVKTTTVERFKVSQPPTQQRDGNWTIELDGKTYTKPRTITVL